MSTRRHDGHMAIMLGVVRALSGMRGASAELLSGRVRFLFQPAEEGGFGAQRMIAGGCLEGVDTCYGLHLWNFMPCGIVGVAPGPITANSDRVRIEVRGSGGHGSMPQGTVDAVLVAAHLVVALQSVVARNVDPFEPAVVTLGTLNAGAVANAIAQSAVITGTVRSTNEATRGLVRGRMREVCEGVGCAFGAQVVFTYTVRRSSPPPTHTGALTPVPRAFQGSWAARLACHEPRSEPLSLLEQRCPSSVTL